MGNATAKHVGQKEFHENLKLILDKTSEIRTAWQEARQAGCTNLNLITFLYAYSVGEELVMGPRRESRKSVLRKLADLAKKIESAATEAEQLLNFCWWKEESVSELLSSLNVELYAEHASIIRDGIESPPIYGAFKVKGTLRPDLILELPQTLRLASQVLSLFHNRLCKEKGWDERTVGRTIYLAELVLYWQTVSGKGPAWKDVAAVVEGSRIAAGSRGRYSDETALRLNFENFRKRNPIICSDLETSLAEYLQTGVPNVSFYTWSRQSKGTP